MGFRGGEVCHAHSLHKFINHDWKLESQPPAVCVFTSCSEAAALTPLTVFTAQLKREWQTFTLHTLCRLDYFSAVRQPGVRPGSDNTRLCELGSSRFYFSFFFCRSQKQSFLFSFSFRPVFISPSHIIYI